MRRARRALTALAAVALLSVLLTTPTAQAEPAGRYIVTVTGSGPVAAVLQSLVTEAGGGTVVQTYEHALRGGLVELAPAAAAVLAALPGVTGVEADGVFHTDQTNQSPAPSWGIDRIDQRNLPLNGTYSYTGTGAGVKAYIIDTGIKPVADFGGRAVAGVDTVDPSLPSLDDCNGHGTHVSGTVGGAAYGVAKQVTLVAVRVFACADSTSTSAIIAGLDWATADHQAGQPAVANMSLGGGASAALDTAVRNLIADGVTVAIAAGNDGANACSNTSPARVTEGVTVGATDSTDTRASFSNFGTCVDVHAPGVNVVSDWPTGGSNTLSGTSMATPHVTGAAARYLSAHPGATPATVQSGLKTDSTKGVIKGIATSCNILQQLLGTCTAGTPNQLLYVPPTS